MLSVFTLIKLILRHEPNVSFSRGTAEMLYLNLFLLSASIPAYTSEMKLVLMIFILLYTSQIGGYNKKKCSFVMHVPKYISFNLIQLNLISCVILDDSLYIEWHRNSRNAAVEYIFILRML